MNPLSRQQASAWHWSSVFANDYNIDGGSHMKNMPTPQPSWFGHVLKTLLVAERDEPVT
jgi:hypothetical protein